MPHKPFLRHVLRSSIVIAAGLALSVAADEASFLQRILDKAWLSRAAPHSDLKTFEPPIDATVAKITEQGYVLRLQASNSSDVFHFHFTLCQPDDATPAWVSDALILGPRDSAQQLYEDNLTSRLDLSVEFMRCLAPGASFTQTGKLTRSRTRILSDMGELARYFLVMKLDPARGADLLRVAAEGWREELQSRDEPSRLQEVLTGLSLIELSFPFDLLAQQPALDAATRASLRNLLSTTLYLRRKLAAFDDKAGTQIPRDTALLARLGPP